MSETIPEVMSGVHLIGHGGFDKLQYRTDIPTPQPAAREVLIRVAAAGINNTDINTRIGWYAKSARGATAESLEGINESAAADGGWFGDALQFPRIQGADCCGVIAAVGDGVDAGRIGERVLVRAMQGAADRASPFSYVTFGLNVDGAFAQYAKTDSTQAVLVDSDWSDVELASIPCAYSTAEGMLDRAGVGAERVRL